MSRRDLALLSLVEQVRSRARRDQRVPGGIKLGKSRVTTGWSISFVTPLQEPSDGVVIMLQERGLSEKIDRQLTHRGAGRSVAAMASVLAHEVKNPLSGIRGAAQLLETDATDGDRALTRLICEETDRIVKLVDRMSAFSEIRPFNTKKLTFMPCSTTSRKSRRPGLRATSGFTNTMIPRFPRCFGNKDQLIQIFLNLVKNAAEVDRRNAQATETSN